MALTTTLGGHGGKQPSAPLISFPVDVDLDNSYPTGGYDFDPGALLKSLGKYSEEPEVLSVLPESKAGYVFTYDRATKKLLAYYADYDAVADGALIEVANATNLAAVTGVRVLVLAR